MESVNQTVNSIWPRWTECRKTKIVQTFVALNKLLWFIAYENISCNGATKGGLCMTYRCMEDCRQAVLTPILGTR
jgi:hypothetical protein